MILQLNMKMQCKPRFNKKTHYDKNAEASKAQKRIFFYVLQLQTDHQINKNCFTDFRCFGPYIVERASPNDNYPVPKNRADKTQVLQRMWLWPFSFKKSIPDIKITSPEWKLDPEVMICTPVHGRLILETLEVTVESDETNAETCFTPGTARECSMEIFSLKFGLCDGTDTDHSLELDQKKSSQQLIHNQSEPYGTKCDIRYESRPNCNEDYS